MSEENKTETAEKKTLKHEKKEREPFIRMIRRPQIPMWKAWAIRLGAILISLVFCALVTVLVTGENPFSLYAAMWRGAFGKDYIWSTMQNVAILLCISLAVTPAFKMHFWNTGAEGQTLIAALATAMCMFFLGDVLPTWLLFVVMIAASILAGILWAVIPAVFLKIADKSGSNTVGPSLLTKGWFPVIGGQKYLLNILIVAVVTVLVYIYLKYSKHGYEISVVGESEKTARYIGINVKKVIIRTMILSGAICGLTGLLLVAGTSHSIDSNLVEGRGFTAIMVSWLAKFNPLAMIFASVLLVFMDRGAEEVTSRLGLNSSYSEILTGIILFFIIGCEFFIQYKLVLNHKHKEVKA